MDDDPSDGTKRSEAEEKARGSVKEAIGKVSGDAATEAEGKAQKDAASRRRQPPDGDTEPEPPPERDQPDD